MAAQRKTTARKPKAPLEEAAEAVTETPQEQPSPDGVFVVVNRAEGGGVGTSIQTIGDVKVTEVQTILELALKAFRSEAGLA